MAEDLWAGWDGLVLRYPADWRQACTSRCQPGHRRETGGGSICPMAGFLRSEFMVDLGVDACLACFKAGARNRGTKHCADYAKSKDVPVIKIWG